MINAKSMQRNVSLCLTGVSPIYLMIIKCFTITEKKDQIHNFELNHYRKNIFILNPEKYSVHKMKFKYALSFGLKTHRP